MEEQAGAQQQAATEAAPSSPPESQEPQGERARTPERSFQISRAINSWLRSGGQQTTTDVGEASSRGADEPPQAAPASDKADRQQPAPSVWEGDPSESVTMTRADWRRTVQSDRDRLIANENRRNQEMASMRATAAQYDLLKELSDPVSGDPERLMEEVGKFLSTRDQQAQHYARQSEIDGHIRDVGDGYDNQVVRPLLARLPHATAQRIVDQSPAHLVGLAHRVHIVDQAMQALEQQWMQRGEERARKSLSSSDAFRKQVWHEQAGGRPTPELIEAAAPSRAAPDTNTWLRGAFRS